MRGLLLPSVLLSLLMSCSGKLVQRDESGFRVREPSSDNTVKKRVALLPLMNEAPFGGEDLEITGTEELRAELNHTGEFLVDPNAANIFGSSKEIYAGGGVQLAQLSRKARIQGINFVIFGRIIEARIREKNDEIGLVRQTNSYTESIVEIKIFDVHAGKEIFSESLKGYADDQSYRFFTSEKDEQLTYRQELLRYAVRVAVRKVIPKAMDLAAKMDWMGRVAKIIGSKVYVNAGRASGIHIGDVLRVLTETKEVFDPESGGLIGMSKGETKGTLEIIDYFGQDGAVAILHSGGSVVEGDLVQLY